jgi:hypothetical protein
LFQDLMRSREHEEQKIAQENKLAERALDTAWNKVWEEEAAKDLVAAEQFGSQDAQESMTESQWVLKELRDQRKEKEEEHDDELRQREQAQHWREQQQQKDQQRQEGGVREQQQFGQLRRQLEQQLEEHRPKENPGVRQDYVDLMKRQLEQLLEEERNLEYANKEAMEARVTEIGAEFRAMRDMERGIKGQLATLHARLQELKMQRTETFKPALSKLLQSRIAVRKCTG